MYPFMIMFLVLGTHFANALPLQDATKYVPGGKVVQVKKREMKVLTPKNSIVEIEFLSNDEFEEASGDDIDRDIFIPGQGLKDLSEAVAAARKANKTVAGDWSLEKSFLRGWIYELDGFDRGQKMEYSIDAKTGEFISEHPDD